MKFSIKNHKINNRSSNTNSVQQFKLKSIEIIIDIDINTIINRKTKICSNLYLL